MGTGRVPSGRGWHSCTRQADVETLCLCPTNFGTLWLHNYDDIYMPH